MVVHPSHSTFSSSDGAAPLDLRIGPWVRDFVVLGAGIGLLAPCVLLGPMVWGAAGEGVLLALVLACAFLGGVLGLFVGPTLYALAAVGRSQPLLTGLLGFPIGAAAGFAVGALVGGPLGELELVGTLGMVTGGLVLGFLWMPYLALHLRGRSGLPVALAGVVCSPIMAVLAIVSTLALGLMR
ncbi:MAG: hypothetical protein R3F61_16055 [Myxococcota bacterium]